MRATSAAKQIDCPESGRLRSSKPPMSSASSAPGRDLSPPRAERVADRYLVEAALGRGGMGSVLRVLDESTGQRLALKRLTHPASLKHVMLFEREFYTLQGLKHPHIVEVFDYGTSPQGPYYTMELLSGDELSGLAPLPWREVSTILRDIASALALLHARHLLHRDLSARNVWRTESGIIKLIDFGALTSFGKLTDFVGTAPYAAPETLRSRTLDQRADLYAMGALGYYLLTGRHAFPACSVAELEEHWANAPTPPSQLLRVLRGAGNADVPPALDGLIGALLSAEPAERPFSAAEIIDRLQVVHPTSPLSESAPLADGFLESRAFVGRVWERKKLRSALKRVHAGSAMSVAIHGPTGIGRTRLLSELAFDARASGALVLQLSPSGLSHTGALFAPLALQLLERAPGAARQAALPYAAVLGHLSDAVRKQLGLQPADLAVLSAVPLEARMRVQAALRDWLFAISTHRPVALLVDDMQAADETSAGFLAALAKEAREQRLLLAISVRSADGTRNSSATEAFLQSARRVALLPLSAEEILELLRSVFGDASHLARVAERLTRASGGAPGPCMDLAHHLVSRDLARYVDGAWVLPPDIADIALPESEAELQSAQLAQLAPNARTLAQVLSTVSGVVSLEVCRELSGLRGAELFWALEVLVGAGVLAASDDGYHFVRDALKATLFRELDEPRKRSIHLWLGEHLLSREQINSNQRLEAGVYLLRGGDVARGAREVTAAAVELVRCEPDNRASMTPYLEEALAFFRQRHNTDHELVALLFALAHHGYLVERRLGMQYGDEALERLQRVLKLGLARKLRPLVGRRLSFMLAFLWGFLSFLPRRQNPLVPPFMVVSQMLVGTAACLAGMYTVCLDAERTRKCAEALEPFRGLGKHHGASLMYEYCLALLGTVQEQFAEARQRWQRVVDRLYSDRPIDGMPSYAQQVCQAGALYASGVVECWRDDSRALSLAKRLEQQPLKLYQVGGEQLRAVYHAQQGNIDESDACALRVEAHALQRGLTWQIDVWAPASAITTCKRTKDALRMKLAAEQLKYLSAETPSLAPLMYRARATYLLLRRRYAEAQEALEEAIRGMQPGVIGWTNTLASLAEAQNALDDHAAAKLTCMRALERLGAEDLNFPAQTLEVQIQLALAEAGLGDTGQASLRLEVLLEQHREHQGPLTLGALHEARARVAGLEHDAEAARRHWAEMERWYRGTGTRSLLHYCDVLQSERNRLAVSGHPQAAGFEDLLEPATQVERSRSCRQDQRLPQRTASALEQLLEGADVSEGYLFVASEGGYVCRVKAGTRIVSKQLAAWVSQRLAAMQTVSTQADEASHVALTQNQMQNQTVVRGKTYSLHVMSLAAPGGERVLGGVVLARELAAVPVEPMRALAERIQESSSGDWSEPAST
jgi:serine/threonine protein kinase